MVHEVINGLLTGSPVAIRCGERLLKEVCWKIGNHRNPLHSFLSEAGKAQIFEKNECRVSFRDCLYSERAELNNALLGDRRKVSDAFGKKKLEDLLLRIFLYRCSVRFMLCVCPL